MARWNVSIKNSLDSYDHTAIKISLTGAATFSGPNMLNSLCKPAMGITHFQCVLGFQPRLQPWSEEPSELPAVDSWLQRSEETWNDAHIYLQRAVFQTREQDNRHRRTNPNYQPGQWIWLSTRDLHPLLPCKKLSPRYVGPFKILRPITPVSFRLALYNNRIIQYLGTGKGTARRNGPGSMQRIFWIPLLPQTSTRIGRPRDPVEDPCVICLFMSGTAHRGGALSQIQPLWLPPITTRGNYHQSIDRSIQTSFPTHPVPETDYLHRFFSLLGLFKLCQSCSHCEVLFCYAVISERFSRVCLPVDTLDCLPVYDCLLPAYSDPACLAELFYCLSAQTVYESALPSLYLTLLMIYACLTCIVIQ